MTTKKSFLPNALNLIFWLMMIPVFVLTIVSCKKEKKEEPTPPSEDIVLASNTVGIDSADWENSLISFDSSTFTIVFDGDILTTYSFHEGDILVSSVGAGFLRKISSVSITAGQVTLTTAPARLTDLIKEGVIDVSGSLKSTEIEKIVYHRPGIGFDTVMPVRGGAQADFNWNIDVVLYDADNNPLTTGDQILLEGNFQIVPTYDIYIVFDLLQGITEAKFGFGAQEDLNLELRTELAYSFEQSVDLLTIYLSPIVIPAPPPVFSILIFPEITLEAGIEGYANATITTSVEQGISYEAGLIYYKGPGWSTYSNEEYSFGYQPPELTMNAGAKAYIKPELIFKLYGLVGPYVNSEIYGRIDANLFETPWWVLYAGFNVGAGVRIEAFDWTMLDYEVPDLISWEQVIAQASSGPELPAVLTSGITDITEISAVGGGNVTSEGISLVTARGVCWSTTENPTVLGDHTEDGSGTGSYSSNISGLMPSTPYYVRAYATNSAGTSYGDQVSFTTLEGGGSGESCPGIPSVSYEGKVYHTILIGDQCWFKENLNVGSQINGAIDQTDNGIFEKYCYDNNEANCATYGGLYQWNEMMQYNAISGTQGICPDGWHIPTDAEWFLLSEFLGGAGVAGGKMKEAGFAHWASPNIGATNSSGFTALAGGERFIGGFFIYQTNYAFFWTSTQHSGIDAWSWYLSYIDESVTKSNEDLTLGYSVRCIKDEK